MVFCWLRLLACIDGTYGWWHVTDGKVVFDDTVARNGNGWWVIRDGKVNFDYIGKYQYNGGTYTIRDGKVIN